MTEIPIELNGGMLPVKGSDHAAAFDVYCPEDFELKKRRNLILLGFCIELPDGWKANIRPRSGFSVNGFLAEVRTKYRRYNGEEYESKETVRIDADVILGLVDSDYRGEVGVIVKVFDLDCLAPQMYQFDTIVESHVFVTKGTRFAQMEICGGDCELRVVDRISRKTDRGGGYGHTGTR